MTANRRPMHGRCYQPDSPGVLALLVLRPQTSCRPTASRSLMQNAQLRLLWGPGSAEKEEGGGVAAWLHNRGQKRNLRLEMETNPQCADVGAMTWR